MSIKLEELKKWGSGRAWSKAYLVLNPTEIVKSRERFFNSHIAILEGANSEKGKASAMPYYDRLVKFYNLINKENDRD